MLMTRQCPTCNNPISYQHKQNFDRANREGRVCHGCRYKLYLPSTTGKPLSPELRKSISDKLKGRKAWNKGIPMSLESKKKLSASLVGRATWSKGKTFSDEYRKKLQFSHQGQSSPMKGRHHTDETRYKIRLSIIEKLKMQKISHRSNPVACMFMDNVNSTMGWNLQHAGNGGEIQIYGYSLDGYDDKQGIIFEYDEPRHHLVAKKKKDIQRQQDLFKYFKNIGKSISFWRYDERYKTLYEVVP